MITGKDSWKVLVIGLVVMAITGVCGGLCMAGYKSVGIGLLNILFGFFITCRTYKFYEKKSKTEKR